MNPTHQNQHDGFWGDVEWWTSNEDETPHFFRSDTSVREVFEVEARWAIQINEPVCQYGRVSNDPDCTLRINGNNIWCELDGDWKGSLAQVNGDTGVGGDSVGPWYFGHVAFGSHVGNCVQNDGTIFEVFTPADLYDEALEIDVMARDRLNRSQTLFAGQGIFSPNGQNLLIMQSDGNLVLYQNGAAKWCACWEGAAAIPGNRVVMQADGNFVIYTSVWDSGTQISRALIRVQNDGNGIPRQRWLRPTAQPWGAGL